MPWHRALACLLFLAFPSQNDLTQTCITQQTKMLFTQLLLQETICYFLMRKKVILK